MPDLFPPTLDELIAEAELELRYRQRVYPRRVAAKQMSQAQADKRLALQVAIIAMLKGLRVTEVKMAAAREALRDAYDVNNPFSEVGADEIVKAIRRALLA